MLIVCQLFTHISLGNSLLSFALGQMCDVYTGGRGIKNEPRDHEFESLVFLDSQCVEETVVEEKRKRRRLTASGGEYDGSRGNSSMEYGPSALGGNSSNSGSFMVNAAGEEVRMKCSVQKLVDSALTPFLCKLEELFDPNSSTMQVARTSQHVITLWNADLLLTKLFDQNELTKYFTDYMNEIMEVSSFQTEDFTSNVGSYVVETLINANNLDESYTRVGSVDSVVPDVETLTMGDMQIINYTQMEAKHIPKYARLIALYKFRIVIGGDMDGKSLELEDASLTEGLNGLDHRSEQLTRLCIKQVSSDLSKRTITDLDVKLNGNYQEEMIMHIIVEQMESDKILPLCIGIFLAKGCSFCRKRECKAEDLQNPICPDNPVCPDRQCIKRNLVCHICNKQMANSKSLTRHKYSVHDLQSGETAGLYICSHCGETFSKKWKLNVHEKQHEDRKLQVACHICHKVMRGAIALKKHINMVHETKRKFMCDHCHKMFKRKETLLVHRRIHTGEKPFVCSHCDYSSETKGNLKAHTWRKHKRPLLATAVGNNGIETSITGPVSTVEEMLASSDDGVHHKHRRRRRHTSDDESHSQDPMEDESGSGAEETVLEGPVMELDEEHQATGDELGQHDHLQETTFMIS